MRLLSYLFICLLLFSCKSKDGPPDVSHIKVNLSTMRFEKDLFAIDSAMVSQQIDNVIMRYGEFGPIFMTKILNADPSWSEDTLNMYVGGFINAYKPLNSETRKLFSDFTPYENEIRHALQYVKYYFAAFIKRKNYQIPERIITYIGPLDGYGDNFIQGQAFIVGLHHHLGAADSLYQNEYLHQTYPTYITNRFEPSTITVNAMTRLLNDMYPPDYMDETLVNQMIESGKRFYVLQQLMPDKNPALLIGYESKQYRFCVKNEALLWNFFTQNELLQKRQSNLIRNYIGDSPKTQEFGEESPGNIGSFVGWKIVDKYMSDQKNLPLDKLMETPADEILAKARYKP